MTTQLSRALGLSELPEHEQEELELDMQELIFKGSLIRMLEQMNETTKDKLEALFARDATPEEIQEFLTQEVTGSRAAIEETIKELHADIAAVSTA